MRSGQKMLPTFFFKLKTKFWALQALKWGHKGEN